MTPKSNRYWWTAPLGATDNGDDERISNTSEIKNYDDIEEDFTGLGGPLNGSVFLFSYGGVWKGINTGLAAAPYVTMRIAGASGAIHHRTIIKGEDENGEPALYWLSPVGPVRYGTRGFQRLHEDIDDIWRDVNLSATSQVAHGVYHRDKHQIWWWVATGGANTPNKRIVFDVKLGKIIDAQSDNAVRKGWAIHTGDSCAAACSTMMSDSLGATMSATLKPYIGQSGGTNRVWKCDTGTTDNGTTYQAYIKTKPYSPWGLRHLGTAAEEAMLVAAAASGVTITCTMVQSMGDPADLTSSCVLTAAGSETHVFRKFDDFRFAQANTVQLQIGDSAAIDNSWNLDLVVMPWKFDGNR